MNLNELGMFIEYYKILCIMDRDTQQKLVTNIDTIEGFLTPYQILLLFLFWQNKHGNFVELGSYFGKSTTTALLALAGNNYIFHSIDTFAGSPEHQERLQGASTYDIFIENLKRFGVYNEGVLVHKGTSIDMAPMFEDCSVDVIFIDAAHDYDNVVLDIESWYPKLKHGGFMIGHDYPHPQDPNGGFEGLRDAVNKYVRDDKRFQKFGHLFAIWGAQKV